MPDGAQAVFLLVAVLMGVAACALWLLFCWLKVAEKAKRQRLLVDAHLTELRLRHLSAQAREQMLRAVAEARRRP